MTMPDGTTQYIGNCALHMDYEGRGITRGKTVVEEFEFYSFDDAEVEEFYSTLSPIAKKLTKIVSLQDGSYNKEEPEYMVANNFDDFEAFEVKLDLWGTPKKKLTVVDYGVGGGNGGFMFFENDNGDYKLVGNSFDGELLYCDEGYTFETNLN